MQVDLDNSYRSDFDFALSLDLDLRGKKFKTAITQLYLKLGARNFVWK